MTPEPKATADKPTLYKRHWWDTPREEDIHLMHVRIKDLERTIEKNVRFAGLSRWQRIFDGGVMWFIAGSALILFTEFMHRLFPNLVR